MATINSWNSNNPAQVALGGTGAATLTGVLTGNGTSPVTANAITQHGILIGGASNAVSSLGVASNGQIAIGSAGADPVLATLSAGTGINITNGAGTITIATLGGGLTWTVITVNQTAAIDNGYFCNKSGTLALLLPAASAVGDTFEVANINTAAGIQITQAAGQQIFIANTSTTSGATGTLTSTSVGDTLTLVCRAANLTWQVTSMIGNWTPA